MTQSPPPVVDRDQYLKFGRPGNSCLLCGKPLNVDGSHPSLIQLSEKEEAVRHDFCRDCWGQMGKEEYFSYWLTKRITSASPEQRRLARSERNEALWRLFAALNSSDSQELGPQLFLLAHLLMRYKVLVYSGTTEDGRLRFTHPKLGESFEVPDLALDSVDFVRINTLVEQQALAYAPSNATQADTQEPETA